MDNIVKNTLEDIYDVMPKVSSVEDTGFGEWHTIDRAKIIEKIETPMWGKYPELRNKKGEIISDAVDIRLNSYLQKMPHGIVDKKRPGIGATTLEINSNRNSIIVVPTKILAHNKTLQHSHTCYVGSAIKSPNYTTQGGKKEIYEYIKRYTHIRKFIVVADSLKNLIEVLEKTDSDVYNNYFFMVDEVDLMQSDSTFRPSIENVMDYYFRFNIKKRCLVTATMKDFSNPLLKNECRFDLTDYKPIRKLNVCHTNNILFYIKNYIENEGEGKKILIAYNSVSKAKVV